MKLETAMTAILLSGMLVSPALAQDKGKDQPASTFRAEQRAPRVPQLNLPSSPILPMTNPIAPMMTAPVQPFVRYQGPQGTPTVVVPPTKTEDRDRDDRDRRRGRDDRDVPVVILGGGVYVPPYYDSVIYQQPYLTPAPVPGQLPGTYPVTLPSSSYVPPTSAESTSPASTAGVPAAPAPVAQPLGPRETIFYPDSNVIITPEPPTLTVERPALGITRSDAIARYGEPWGSITLRGRETLYFRGGLVVAFENDRAVEIR
jgi:hypothetical protein